MTLEEFAPFHQACFDAATDLGHSFFVPFPGVLLTLIHRPVSHMQRRTPFPDIFKIASQFAIDGRLGVSPFLFGKPCLQHRGQRLATMPPGVQSFIRPPLYKTHTST